MHGFSRLGIAGDPEKTVCVGHFFFLDPPRRRDSISVSNLLALEGVWLIAVGNPLSSKSSVFVTGQWSRCISA